MELCGTKRKCLLNSGSDVTLIPSSFIPGCKMFLPTTEGVLAANGTPIRIAGEVNVEVVVKGQPIRVSGLSSDHIWDVMLGNDFLRYHDALRDFKCGQIRLDGRLFPLCWAARKKWCRRVILQQSVTVPVKSEAILPSWVVHNDLSTPKIQGQS